MEEAAGVPERAGRPSDLAGISSESLAALPWWRAGSLSPRAGGLIRTPAALLRADSVTGTERRTEAASVSGLPRRHGQEEKPCAVLSLAADLVFIVLIA